LKELSSCFCQERTGCCSWFPTRKKAQSKKTLHPHLLDEVLQLEDELHVRLLLFATGYVLDRFDFLVVVGLLVFLIHNVFVREEAGQQTVYLLFVDLVFVCIQVQNLVVLSPQLLHELLLTRPFLHEVAVRLELRNFAYEHIFDDLVSERKGLLDVGVLQRSDGHHVHSVSEERYHAVAHGYPAFADGSAQNELARALHHLLEEVSIDDE